MATVGVVLVGIGVLFMYEAWESHKKQTPPAPIQSAVTALGGLKATSTPAAAG